MGKSKSSWDKRKPTPQPKATRDKRVSTMKNIVQQWQKRKEN